jgi:hypothetical protein
VRTIEDEFLTEILRVMHEKRITQTDYAKHRGSSRQSVNPYLTGKKLLLSPIGSDLLEFLGVRIKLEVIPESERINTPARDARDTASKS